MKEVISFLLAIMLLTSVAGAVDLYVDMEKVEADDYLLGRTDPKEQLPTDIDEEPQNEMEQRLMEYVREMTHDQKKMLLAQMQVLKEQNEQ